MVNLLFWAKEEGGSGVLISFLFYASLNCSPTIERGVQVWLLLFEEVNENKVIQSARW